MSTFPVRQTSFEPYNRLAPLKGAEARDVAERQGPMDAAGLEQIAGYFERLTDFTIGAVTAHRLRLLAKQLEEMNDDLTIWRNAAITERLHSQRLEKIVADMARELAKAEDEEHTILFVFQQPEDADPGSLGVELGMELAYLLSLGGS